jgi:hypothetical protein
LIILILIYKSIKIIIFDFLRIRHSIFSFDINCSWTANIFYIHFLLVLFRIIFKLNYTRQFFNSKGIFDYSWINKIWYRTELLSLIFILFLIFLFFKIFISFILIYVVCILSTSILTLLKQTIKIFIKIFKIILNFVNSIYYFVLNIYLYLLYNLLNS